ncbi:hypothetical protein GL58_02885 [Comamonas testosteroni]|uniref:Uncharacterized protein n=1 Tax=Comamonas testosteroni TaxID=285 RepID=A0A0L7MPR7_COMTE|nr:hypothetical protein [Comamonas testosteroni]KOC23931.1 hypothetical protein GL58_02885 [Comamonas testosteroni]KWT67791.1 hypothetical protein APV28_3596 [Comamonas testosteroni]
MGLIKRSSLQTVQTGTLHLKDVRGIPMMFSPEAVEAGAEVAPQPVIVTIYGPGSEQHRKAQQAARQRILELLRQSGDGARPRDLSDEERHADGAELLADMVADITGFDFEGQTQREFLRGLFADPSCGYITDQVNSFAGDWANFCKGAVKA